MEYKNGRHLSFKKEEAVNSFILLALIIKVLIEGKTLFDIFILLIKNKNISHFQELVIFNVCLIIASLPTIFR